MSPTSAAQTPDTLRGLCGSPGHASYPVSSMLPSEPAETIAAADTPHGEVVLRRRGGHLELIVNGAFAMDSVDISTETALATISLRAHGCPSRVLVGGLGLGYTTRAVLADPRVERVDVVELAQPLIDWSRCGLVPELAGIEADGRARVHQGDVTEVLRHGIPPEDTWDVILLDVDNGPDFLVHEANAALYAAPALHSALARLSPGGLLAVWSSHLAPGLLAQLRELDPNARELPLQVQRDGRDLVYAVYLASPPGQPRHPHSHP